MTGRPRLVVSCLALAGAIVAVYHRVGGFAFVFDDEGFLHSSPAVLKGLTGEGARWAFTTFHTGNWYPLTWFSHMLDVQLFGLSAGPHHLVNLALHASNSVLLLLVLRRLTGVLWPSAFVAALFAVHPLHVESVAWVAERKDLLSALFWILALGAYVRYAAFPRARRYALVVFLFVLGCMAKPMVVTFPVVLLLLDWWPLGRLPRACAPRGAWTAYLLEKAPLFALSGTLALVTYRAQAAVGAVVSEVMYRPVWRVENALISCIVYIEKALWPVGLAAYYPFPIGGQPGPAGWALLLLAGLSSAALVAYRCCPALTTGWFWYLVTLTPVIGLVQVGGQARADRYMYLPLIGLALAGAWCAPPLLRRLRISGAPLAALVLLALAALAVAAGRQSETWRTKYSLYGRMIEVTRGNWVAHNGYAVELQGLGRLPEAIEHFRAAVAVNVTSEYLHRNLAFALDDAGRADEAVEQLRTYVYMSPGDAEAQFRLGLRLGEAGRYPQSLTALREATRLRPQHSGGWAALGVTCANLGRRAEAEAAFREALRFDPGNQNARRNLERLRSLR